TVFLRRTRAARCADHRTAAHGGDEQEIAGIDRHAEMLDAPADRRDRGGDHVAPVGDGGRPGHDDELRALPEHVLDRARQRGPRPGGRRGAAPPRLSATMLARAGARRSSVTFKVFSMTLPARPGNSVETTPILRMR